MPEPTQPAAPTPAQLARLRGILGLETAAEVLAEISDFSTLDEANAEWALTVADLASLSSLGARPANLKKIEGVIEFYEGGFGGDKLEIVNGIRVRYLGASASLATLEVGPDIRSTLAWF